MTMRAHHRQPHRRWTRSLPLLAMAALLAVATPVWAGDGPCASSKVANSLLGCEHCQAMKKLFGSDEIDSIQVAVFDTPSGVLVQIDDSHLKNHDYAKHFVHEVWTRHDYDERQLSASCLERYSKLEQVEMETATSETGIFLILRSDDEKIISWLQDDARRTREYVLAAASN